MFRALIYRIKNYLHPHNRVKISALDRKWHDRDEIMFHAIFQILVDFVELERPFCSPFECISGRLTDREKMLKDILEFENEPYVSQEHIMFLKELFFLYSWYVDKKYEFDMHHFFKLAGSNYNAAAGTMQNCMPNNHKVITQGELSEMSFEHDLLCEVMLSRVVKIRTRLWT